MLLAIVLKFKQKKLYTHGIAYDSDLRLQAFEYAKEGHTLAKAAAAFKVNISTIIDRKKRYEATGDVKMKIRCPVNKKIIP